MQARRLHRLLAGEDGLGRRALPAGELLHPIPLTALLVLALNDHWLKGAGIVPAAITGKLSDLAGLLFFPLVVTAVADVAVLALTRLGPAWDFSLRRWKLGVATVGTGALFCAIKLSGGAARWLAGLLSGLGYEAAIVADPLDLLALPMLAIAYWLGLREIRRVPLGRLEVLERRWQRGHRDLRAQLEDVVATGGDCDTVDELAAGLAIYFDTGNPEPAATALQKLR